MNKLEKELEFARVQMIDSCHIWRRSTPGERAIQEREYFEAREHFFKLKCLHWNIPYTEHCGLRSPIIPVKDNNNGHTSPYHKRQ